MPDQPSRADIQTLRVLLRASGQRLRGKQATVLMTRHQDIQRYVRTLRALKLGRREPSLPYVP